MPERTSARASARSRVERLRSHFASADRVLIMMQDDPDPDAIASALALRTLLGRTKAAVPIATFGTITRPENRAMTRILDIDVEEIKAHAIDEYDMVAMVDTQPSFFEEAFGEVDLAERLLEEARLGVHHRDHVVLVDRVRLDLLDVDVQDAGHRPVLGTRDRAERGDGHRRLGPPEERPKREGRGDRVGVRVVLHHDEHPVGGREVAADPVRPAPCRGARGCPFTHALRSMLRPRRGTSGFIRGTSSGNS